MVARVIDDVLQHLPDRRRPGLTAEQLVVDDARAAVFAEALHEPAHLRFELRPRAPDRRQVGKLIARKQRRRRMTVPALMPGPFRRVDVCDRLVDRFEAVPHVARQLLGRQRFEGVEQPVARPVVIIEQRPQVVLVHRITFAWRMRSSRGYSRSRYALPPSNNGCCLPARMPLPAFSPYSLFNASATSIPATTRPKGT